MIERAAPGPPSRHTVARPLTRRRLARRRAATLLILAVLGTSACLGSGARQDVDPAPLSAARQTPASETPAESGPLDVVEGRLTRATWAVRKELHLPGRKEPDDLAGPVNAPFTGTMAPAGVPNRANEDLIVYGSFLRKRPVLRLHEAGDDSDPVLDQGAYSPVWGHDQGLAYFKGVTARVDDPARHLGHVVVRASPRSQRVRWTSRPGRYIPTAWAGGRLIVHELGDAGRTLLVFDGPKRRRVLAERAGLVALSPDGSLAFIAKEPRPDPSVAVVDISRGRELARFRFSDNVDQQGEAAIGYVADSGAWTGDIVIAAVTHGLAIFDVSGSRIKLEQLLWVDPDAFPTGLTEPKSDATGRYIAVGAELMQEPGAVFTRTSIMECDRVERRCVLGRSAPSFLPPRLIYNPSRP